MKKSAVPQPSMWNPYGQHRRKRKRKLVPYTAPPLDRSEVTSLPFLSRGGIGDREREFPDADGSGLVPEPRR